MRTATLLLLALVMFAAAGCVRRTMTIDSSPRGALVWLNDREVGRTPVEVDFLFYGDYDVRLEHEDAEPLMTGGRALAPGWDRPPLDLLMELLPVQMHSRVHLHYELEPRRDDPQLLRERAEEMRRRIAGD